MHSHPSLRRLSRLALQNLSRNALLSSATTLMMGLILFIFNVILVLNSLTQSSLDELGRKVDLILYLNNDATLTQTTQLIDELSARPEVLEVTYTSKEDALNQFLELYPDKANPFTQYEIENPLPANIRVVTKRPDEHSALLTELQSSSYAPLLLNTESTNENQAIVERLLKATRFTQKLIVGVVVTFVLGSLLMILNAIHLSIFTRKTEIQIMQLVGAEPSTIYGPFVAEGILYSGMAVIFSSLLLIFFLKSTSLPIGSGWDVLTWLGSELAVSALIGTASSVLATRLYLKHFA